MNIFLISTLRKYFEITKFITGYSSDTNSSKIEIISLNKTLLEFSINGYKRVLNLTDGIIYDLEGKALLTPTPEQYGILLLIKTDVDKVLLGEKENNKSKISLKVYVITDGDRYIGRHHNGTFYSTDSLSSEVFYNELKDAVETKLKWCERASNFTYFSVKQLTLVDNVIENKVFAEYIKVCDTIANMHDRKNILEKEMKKAK